MSAEEPDGSAGPPLSQAELAERLRPRGVAEVLDGAFGLYRQGFAQATVAQLFFALPVVALCVVAPVAAGIWAMLLSPPQRAVSYQVGMDRLLARERSMGQLLRAGVAAWPGLLLLTILMFIVLFGSTMVSFLPLLVPGILLASTGAEAVGVLLIAIGSLVALAAILITVSYLYLWEAVFLFERDWNALFRSFRLVRGAFWKVALTALVALVIVLSPNVVLQAAIVMEAGGFDSYMTNAKPEAWHGIVAALVAVLLTPYSTHVATLLWVDRRAVREGMDLAPDAQHSGPQDNG